MNTSYPLFPITILVILFYLMSLAFSGMGLITRADHRKFWNLLLLITFLATGIIGLLMVVKINYKLEISFYEELVGYHAGFGIGMAVIGFFHFWWHRSYYARLFREEKGKDLTGPVLERKDMDGRLLKVFAFLLGGTSFIAQIILLREFMAVFSGNELVIGLVLANWMILTGIGAYIGKYPLRRISNSFRIVVSSVLILSILPFITAFLINFLKNLVFPIGSMISVLQIFIASFLLLIPFCLISGFLFTFIANCYSEVRNQNETGTIYGYESAGSLTGGFLGGMLFIFVFSSIESLLILAILNGLVVFLINIKHALRKLILIPLIVVIPAFVLLFFHPEKAIRSLVYPNQEIKVSKDSPQGNIVITKRANMWSVYNNNVLLYNSENFMANEEAVHFPMLQHPNPVSVLLVSGDLSGQIAELRKYRNVSIDFVEENQWLMTLLKDSVNKITDRSVRINIIDPLRFIRNTSKTYDVAILNLPGPSTLQSNRFYTIEFFTLLRKKLSGGAVLSLGLESPANYLNNSAVELNSTIFSTLKKVFQNVIIIPGEKNYFLASDATLSYNIAKAIQEKGIENSYVNQYYIDDSLLKNRGTTILSALNPSSEVNQNLKPVLYSQQLSYWLSYFEGKYWLMIVLAGAMAFFVFVKGNGSSKAMFIAGFSATGIEILLLFGLQVFFGNIYLFTCFIFSGFMFGLAVGSFCGKSLKSCNDEKSVSVTQIAIGLCPIGIALLLFSGKMADLPPLIVYILFLLATILIGGLTGLQFAKASITGRGSLSNISGKTYSYDLFGSATGALAVTLYLVPVLGIVLSLYSIAIVNFVFGIWLFLKKKGL